MPSSSCTYLLEEWFNNRWKENLKQLWKNWESSLLHLYALKGARRWINALKISTIKLLKGEKPISRGEGRDWKTRIKNKSKTWQRKGGLFSSLLRLHMKTTVDLAPSLVSAMALLNANWNSKDVFPLQITKFNYDFQ